MSMACHCRSRRGSYANSVRITELVLCYNRNRTHTHMTCTPCTLHSSCLTVIAWPIPQIRPKRLSRNTAGESAAGKQVLGTRDHGVREGALRGVRAETEADQVTRIFREGVPRRPRDAPIYHCQRQAPTCLAQHLQYPRVRHWSSHPHHSDVTDVL